MAKLQPLANSIKNAYRFPVAGVSCDALDAAYVFRF